MLTEHKNNVATGLHSNTSKLILPSSKLRTIRHFGRDPEYVSCKPTMAEVLLCEVFETQMLTDRVKT